MVSLSGNLPPELARLTEEWCKVFPHIEEYAVSGDFELGWDGSNLALNVRGYERLISDPAVAMVVASLIPRLHELLVNADAEWRMTDGVKDLCGAALGVVESGG